VYIKLNFCLSHLEITDVKLQHYYSTLSGDGGIPTLNGAPLKSPLDPPSNLTVLLRLELKVTP